MSASPSRAHYFRRISAERFSPTSRVTGAWRADEQHVAPLAGLITHAIECHRAERGAPPMVLSRLSFDILGQIGLADFDLTVHTVRPGRTIELVEATVTIDDRAVVRARAWLMAEADTTGVEGGQPARLPDPQDLPEWSMASVWPDRGFIASLQVRAADAPAPGRASVWISTDTALLADEPVSPVASFVALIDSANGIAVREDPRKWMFPNLDLSIHFYRSPQGSWTGLDTTVVFGPTGQGLTSTVLHDELGPVGRAEQILTVRELPQ